MRVLCVAALAASSVVLAGCGGSSGGGSQSPAASAGGLVVRVSSPKVVTGPKDVTASAQVSVGGVAGKHLTLEWGLVDALQGAESQAERVIRRIVTTRKVVTETATVKIRNSQVVTPYLVHFVVYAADGAYVASVDTPEFGKGS